MDIYTDGSCLGNPGIGGWAFIIKYNDGETANWANSESETTNNIMELTAALKALTFVQKKNIDYGTHINLYTDSNYVKNGMTSWVHSWVKNDWKTSNNKKVKNESLWKELYEICQDISVQWNHIAAHTNAKDTHSVYNAKVDILANEAAQKKVIDFETES